MKFSKALKHISCVPGERRKPKKKKAQLSVDEMNNGRRTSSVTAQISRQARRFSTAIAPQLTKIEPVNILQKLESVQIKIGDIAQLQRAVENYVMRNSVQFEPVEFDVFDKEGYRVMQGSLYAEELVLQEGTRKICEMSLVDSEDDACLFRMKHPVSGMTVYELRELGGTIIIQTNTDELKGARILTQTSGLASLCMACGCGFSKEKWSMHTEDRCVAMINPLKSFFSENEIQVEWAANCENELRLIAVAFGISQMVRTAFPSLMHIVKEFNNRRG